MTRLFLITALLLFPISCSPVSNGHRIIPIMNNSPERIGVIAIFPCENNMEMMVSRLVGTYERDDTHFVEPKDKSTRAIWQWPGCSFEEDFASCDSLFVAIMNKNDLAKRRNYVDFTLEYQVYKYTLKDLNDLDWSLVYPTKMGVAPIEMYY